MRRNMNPISPNFVPMNVIDRSYLISQAAGSSTYFPMTVYISVRLRNVITPQQVIAVLHMLASRYPQLRLTYKMDTKRRGWKLVPESERSAYLASLVCTSNDDLEAHIEEAVRENHTNIEQPVSFHLVGNSLGIRLHHSMGDGRFVWTLMRLLLTALYDASQLPQSLSPHFGLSAWGLLWQTPGQGLRILGGWIKSFADYYREYTGEMKVSEQDKRDPILSGAPMPVQLHLIPPESVTLIASLKNAISEKVKETYPNEIAKISLNTLMQVLLGQRLRELKLVGASLIYTVPVDLRRYLKDPNDFYPANLAGQVRITLAQQSDLVEECLGLQRQVDKRLQGYGPLVALPSEALLAMNGNLYESINRDWLLNSTDSRFFIFSNLGSIDDVLGNLLPFIEAEAFSAVPLMGRPPLVMSYCTLAGKGNLTLTYDPRVLSPEQVREVCHFYSPEWLTEKLAQYTEKASL
jgi:hypothetical protein